MTRRPLVALTAAVSAVVASVVFWSGPAAAETATVEFSQDGTFWRLQTRAPQVNIPCQAPIPADRCGLIAPTAGLVNPPNVVDGNIVVGHSGGPTGDDAGDQFWAVSQPDVASLGDVESIEKMTLTFTVAPDARGDFGPAVIKGCNIVVPFGVGEGANPWEDRPEIDCSAARVPVIVGTKVTFDVTDFANSWVDGKGFGLAIVPGLASDNTVVNEEPNRRSELFPFQISLISATKIDANQKPFPGRATGVVQYTLAAEEFGGTVDDAGGALGLDDFSMDETGLGDTGSFDTGAFDTGGELGGGGLDAAAGPLSGGGDNAAGAGRLVGSERPGFAWALLLVLPLLALALWGAGNALGPLGDPVPVRQGGVARLVARRQADRNTL